MPDRVLRDELLKSARWWSVSSRAHDLWLGVFLSADDAARYSGAPFPLRTHCMAGTADDKEVEALLAELIKADLLREYKDAKGQRYLFMPRFNQRKRYVKTSRYPEPPKTINDITVIKSDSSQTQDVLKTNSSQTQVRPETRGVGVGVERSGEGLGIEHEKGGTVTQRAARLAAKLSTEPLTPDQEEERKALLRHQAATFKPKTVEGASPPPTPPVAKAPEGQVKTNGKHPPPTAGWTDAQVERKAIELKLPGIAGERYAALRVRVNAAMRPKP